MPAKIHTRCARCDEKNVIVVNVRAGGRLEADLCHPCYFELERIFLKWIGKGHPSNKPQKVTEP